MLVTLEQKVNPRHAALIVVDMQNDFCHSEGAMAKRGRDVSHSQNVVPNLINLLTQARRLNLPVIFVRTVINDWSDSEVALERRRSRMASEKYIVPPVVEGTWGAEFYQIFPQPNDCIVTKHRFSAFVNTDLDLILRSKGIESLIMTGVVTNVCVESTARDGFMRDYYIVFLKDCTGAWNLQDHEATLRNIDSYFGVVTTSDEVIATWAKKSQKLSVS